MNLRVEVIVPVSEMHAATGAEKVSFKFVNIIKISVIIKRKVHNIKNFQKLLTKITRASFQCFVKSLRFEFILYLNFVGSGKKWGGGRVEITEV